MDLKDTIIKQLAAPVKRKGTQEYMTDEEGNIVTSEAAIGMTIVQKALSGDLLLLMTRADGIAMLPGWQASRGAQIENYVSQRFWMQGISKAVTDEIEKIK